jgi:hypothetical protein
MELRWSLTGRPRRFLIETEQIAESGVMGWSLEVRTRSLPTERHRASIEKERSLAR